MSRICSFSNDLHSRARCIRCFQRDANASNPSVESWYRHIVLLVHDKVTGHWGALGLSRRSNLAFRALQFTSLPAIVQSFVQAYRAWDHEVVKVRTRQCAAAL
jgi:Vasohibin